MKQPMVVTNLRIPQTAYLHVKAAAGMAGVSVNEYINSLIIRHSTVGNIPKDVKKRLSIWDLPNAAKKIKDKPMGWSKEDEAIYSV